MMCGGSDGSCDQWVIVLLICVILLLATVVALIIVLKRRDIKAYICGEDIEAAQPIPFKHHPTFRMEKKRNKTEDNDKTTINGANLSTPVGGEPVADTKQTAADTKQTAADTKQTVADRKQTTADTKQTTADTKQTVEPEEDRKRNTTARMASCLTHINVLDEYLDTQLANGSTSGEEDVENGAQATPDAASKEKLGSAPGKGTGKPAGYRKKSDRRNTNKRTASCLAHIQELDEYLDSQVEESQEDLSAPDVTDEPRETHASEEKSPGSCSGQLTHQRDGCNSGVTPHERKTNSSTHHCATDVSGNSQGSTELRGEDERALNSGENGEVASNDSGICNDVSHKPEAAADSDGGCSGNDDEVKDVCMSDDVSDMEEFDITKLQALFGNKNDDDDDDDDDDDSDDEFPVFEVDMNDPVGSQCGSSTRSRPASSRGAQAAGAKKSKYDYLKRTKSRKRIRESSTDPVLSAAESVCGSREQPDSIKEERVETTSGNSWTFRKHCENEHSESSIAGIHNATTHVYVGKHGSVTDKSEVQQTNGAPPCAGACDSHTSSTTSTDTHLYDNFVSDLKSNVGSLSSWHFKSSARKTIMPPRIEQV